MHIRVAAPAQCKLVDFSLALVCNRFKICQSHIRSIQAPAALIALNACQDASARQAVFAMPHDSHIQQVWK